MKHFYSKLAWTNIRNNRQFYLPYILMGILSAMMFYCARAMQGSEGIGKMQGGAYLAAMLSMGVVILGLFVCIFLFYTNSFLMKRRKKEIGIYNVLGMGKQHIACVMFLETLFAFAVSVGGGLLSGILFQKLLTMLLYRLTGLAESVPFYISGWGCLQTAQLFGAIYAAIFLYDFMQVQLANPVELLRGGNVGEREPKTKILMAVIGLACIAAAYAVAIVTEDPISVIMLFFPAAGLVIVGTYCLFTAGSIAFLKMLRGNKRYYYQTSHFTTVSGMIYRMKQNAVGLANICILSTMVLVTISTTVSMYAGIQDSLNERYAYEITISPYYKELPDDAVLRAGSEALRRCVVENGYKLTAWSEKFALSFPVGWRENIIASDKFSAGAEQTIVNVMRRSDYERYAGVTLPEIGEGEVVLIANTAFEGSSIWLDGIEWNVVGTLDFTEKHWRSENLVARYLYFVVRDGAAMEAVRENLRTIYEEMGRGTLPDYCFAVGIDIDGTAEEKLQCMAALRMAMDGRTWNLQESDPINFSSRQEGYEDYLLLNGGLFFLGLFLGTMFLMSTVLIIYYKQISEGYDDAARYAIMVRVGMSDEEVRDSIRAQVRLVFFLPLATAFLHLAASFPMLTRLLAALQFVNVRLFALCLAGTALVFGVMYFAVFRMTSGCYYRIVGERGTGG